ncbi:MAG: biotin transporter BioY [Planctomycetes bacterium]|nr:biotin transporter BioY [Planctomycetota bacterium]
MAVVGKVVGGCALMCLAAQVRVPLPGTVVPMTLQSLSLLLVGFVLCPRHAASAMLLYLACGTLGLPVFSPESAGLLGPTGGYLVGFVLAAWTISALSGPEKPSTGRLVVAGAVGLVVLFATGLGWLTVWLGGDVEQAALMGVVPFVVPALAELALAVACVAVASGRTGRGDDD